MERPANSDRITLGIDVGGTFTDLVGLDDSGRVITTKTPTEPDQSEGVMAGIGKLADAYGWNTPRLLEACPLIVHGTTVATNTMLEYSGAKVGLLTTKGFRDEIEFRRAYKESVFSPRLEPPHAIVPRRLRFGIPERLDHKGKILTPLDEDAVRQAVRSMKADGVTAYAICLLFSFVDPAHEQRVAELVAEEHPEALVSLSSEVLPQIREFERVSTTIVNAYVTPVVRAYLNRLEERLSEHGFRGELLVMQSSGGVQSAEQSAKFGVSTLLSGPAGGVTAGVFLGGRAGFKDLITVDMGGTSCDVAVIENLKPSATTESWVSRYRVALPMLDIHTIGAGGGSIAWVDDGGALRVGPSSAGSRPGPACYGRGGAKPTVTDANLVLGFLNPDYFLGGEMALDAAAATEALDEHVGRPLGITTVEAALAVSDIVNSNMSNAIHFVATKRGHDPRQFALMALGGAGAIHGGRQAEDLGISTVIIPPLGPVLCAFGDVVANLRVAEVRTFIQGMDKIHLDDLNEAFAEMERVAREKLSGQHVAKAFEVTRSIDVRYEGEVHEVTVPLRSRTKRITQLNLEATTSDFHDLHEKLFAHKDVGQPMEVISLRLDLVGSRDQPRMEQAEFGTEDPAAALKASREAFFSREPTRVPVYDGGALQPGHLITGPALIEQWGTTIVIYPAHEALIDSFGNCVIEIGGGGRPGSARD